MPVRLKGEPSGYSSAIPLVSGFMSPDHEKVAGLAKVLKKYLKKVYLVG